MNYHNRASVGWTEFVTYDDLMTYAKQVDTDIAATKGALDAANAWHNAKFDMFSFTTFWGLWVAYYIQLKGSPVHTWITTAHQYNEVERRHVTLMKWREEATKAGIPLSPIVSPNPETSGYGKTADLGGIATLFLVVGAVGFLYYLKQNGTKSIAD